MEKMKTKKVLIALSVIIFIIIVILGVYTISTKIGAMSREEVIALLDKGAMYPNYYYYSSGSEFENKTEYYIKDNIEKVVEDSKIDSWTNYNTNDQIRFLGGNKAAIVKDPIGYEGRYSQHGFSYYNVIQEDVYKYIKKFKHNGRDSIMIQMNNKESKDKEECIIDTQTGLIMRRTDYLNGKKIEVNTNVKLDVVTDEQVKKPDLNGYEILEIPLNKN